MSEFYWCRFNGGSISYALLFVHLSSKICKSSSPSLYGQPGSATPECIMSGQSPQSISPQHAPRNSPHSLTSDANIRNFAPVARIMKTALPENAKIAKEAKECMQECVSEFISFITSEGPSPMPTFDSPSRTPSDEATDPPVGRLQLPRNVNRRSGRRSMAKTFYSP